MPVLVDMGIFGQFICSHTDQRLFGSAIRNLPLHSTLRRLVNRALRIANRVGVLHCIAKPLLRNHADISIDVESFASQVSEHIGDQVKHWVAFVQSKSNRLRVYVYYFDKNYKTVVFAKIGIDEQSHRKIEHEYIAIQKLKSDFYKKLFSFCIPEVSDRISVRNGIVLLFEPLHEKNSIKAIEYEEWNSVITQLQTNRRFATTKEIQVKPWFPKSSATDSDGRRSFLQFFMGVQQDGLHVCRVHGDLTPANIIKTKKKMWVIDWEDYCEEAPLRTDEINYNIQEFSRYDNSLMARRFIDKYLLTKSNSDCYDVLTALAFLAWTGRELAQVLIDNWPNYDD